ncbi:hypothetical protein E4T56_gene20701, partial [Termitomyces sp. T112]
MPRLKRMSGTMQQEEAASAPRMPPAAIKCCRPASPRSFSAGATPAVPGRDASMPDLTFLVEIRTGAGERPAAGRARPADRLQSRD